MPDDRITLEVHRRFTGVGLVSLLDDLFSVRGVPEFIRSDNGSEFISKSLRHFLAFVNVGTSHVDPGSPRHNEYVVIFHSHFHDECLAREVFGTLVEARAVIASWRQTYNHRRPRSSLGGLTPADFSLQWAVDSLTQLILILS